MTKNVNNLWNTEYTNLKIYGTIMTEIVEKMTNEIILTIFVKFYDLIQAGLVEKV